LLWRFSSKTSLYSLFAQSTGSECIMRISLSYVCPQVPSPSRYWRCKPIESIFVRIGRTQFLPYMKLIKSNFVDFLKNGS
jgi:hypothetical protein